MNDEKWLPVNVVLPGSPTIVLITLDYGDSEFEEVTLGIFMKNSEGNLEWREKKDGFVKIPDNSKVVAWMPLPKAFQHKSKNNIAYADIQGLEFADMPTLRSAT